MGGEKLKSQKPNLGIILAGLIFFTGLFGSSIPLSAQTQAPLPDANAAAGGVATPRVDESTLVIGESEAIPAPSSGSSFFIILRMVLVLALAALAVYGVVFFIKRMSRPQEARDPNLKVLARTALSSDTYAAVISVGHKAWLVAGGSGNVNLIAEIDETEPLETMLLEEERKGAEAGNRPIMDFRSLLSKFGSSSRKGQSTENNSFADKIRKQRERLKGP